MGKFIRDNINYIKSLCRKAWEASKHFGGAFLNNVFVDYRNGSIWYDTEHDRICLAGWKVARAFKDVRDKFGNLVRKPYWAIMECSVLDNL